jgi:replicative DNA helicase
MVDELRPDVLYIDAAYLVSVNGSSAKMWEKLAMVGERLKELAISRDIPILQTVQFNRDAVKTKTFDLHTIGGSDTIGQLGSVIYAITEAEAPYNETRRNISVIKNREGSVAEFDIHYTFDPPNFTEVTVGEQHNKEDEVVLI